MTSDDRRQQERRPADEQCVDALLAEGGFPDDAELRAVLLQLRALRVTDVPEPSGELAALLGRPAGADVVRLEDWSRKHPRKKRAVFTTLAVAASLGVAGGAAAGNETLRSQAEGTITGIIRTFTPPERTTPAPAPPSEAPQPSPAVVPSPAATPAGVPVPAAPAPVRVPGSEPRVPDSGAPGRSPQMPQQAEAPSVLPPVVPPAGGRPAEPGASRPAEVPPPGEPPAGGPDVSNDGNAKAKAGADGAAGQDAGQPGVPQDQGNRR